MLYFLKSVSWFFSFHYRLGLCSTQTLKPDHYCAFKNMYLPITFACRCIISSVWRWNKAVEDAEWNHKHRHNSCPFCKCLPPAADNENAGIAQCRYLHQGWEQKHILWIVWCEVRHGITATGFMGLRFFVVFVLLCTYRKERNGLISIWQRVAWHIKACSVVSE